MKITLLGTGTSSGIPQLGCRCDVCCSADYRDQRLRTSALVESESGTRLLIDCGPDFRRQLLQQKFAPFQAILLTHHHYDHIGGMEELRPKNIFGDIIVYAQELCAQNIEKRLKYLFLESKYPGIPQIKLRRVNFHETINIGDLEIQPFKVWHGELPIVGYRIGDLAYITDMKTLPEEEFPLLVGVKLLVVNALRFQPHHSHQTIEEALAFARRVGAERTRLIHLSHHAGLHARTTDFLPEGIAFGYDGEVLEY